MHCLEGWKQLILNIFLYNLPEKQEETEKLQNLPCIFTKHFNKKHRICVFTVPNLISWPTPMMMYLSWDAASLTCCQNHGGHTWSQHPSSIFTGMNHTGKVRAVWNRFQTQHAVCVNGLFATSPLCHDPAAWALHYPSIWKWLRAGASSTNSPPPPKINSLLFSFHQLSPITLLDIKNFPSKKKNQNQNPTRPSHAREIRKMSGSSLSHAAKAPCLEHPRDACTQWTLFWMD